MDERLEKALDFSNYMVTLNNQKRVLREQYKENIVYYYNKGQFTVTQELITFVNMLVDKSHVEDVVLIDDNETPIFISALDTFLNAILDRYFSATNHYYTEYIALTQKRSTNRLVDYDE